jgi:DNA-binding MarR family transcriptional regulator
MASKTAVPAPAEESVPLSEVASRLRLSVLRLSRRLRRHAPVGITPSQLSALATIVGAGRITLSRLAEAERVQPPSITRVVDRLVTLGFVTRTQSDEDRRVAWVAVTDDGRALVENVRRRRDLYLAHRLRSFSAEDRAVLARAAVLLERLTEDPQ